MEQTHLMFNPKQSIIIYDFAIYSTKRRAMMMMMTMRERTQRMQVSFLDEKNGLVEMNHGLTFWLPVNSTQLN